MKMNRAVYVLAHGAISASIACGAPSDGEKIGTTSGAVVALPAVSASTIATIALANVGLGACSTNTQGGAYFDSSCTGNGGSPEYWCADFAKWVWAAAGASNTSELTAAAGSFYVFGQNHGTLHSTPSLGDAAVFNYQGGGVADHVALVTQVNADGTIETASGDWGGASGSEAVFAGTSHVVLNAPAYPSAQGTTPGVIGMTISGFVSPVGVTGSETYGAGFVSQTFPLAATALTMVAGDTRPQSITLKNTGSKAWDGNTRLGTTHARDRKSAFADGSWLSANRPAGVTGTVAPGDTYTFALAFHAPSTPGTYFEYFNVVEEGVAWFGDPGQGGPADNDLEAQIIVLAGPDAGAGGEAPDAAASAPAVDAGVDGAVGEPAVPGNGVSAGADAAASDSTSPAAPTGPGGATSGCSITRGAAGSSAWLIALGPLSFLLARPFSRRRRRGAGRSRGPALR